MRNSVGFTLIASAMALIGCNDKTTPSAAGAPDASATSKPPSRSYEVTISGEPVRFKSVYAFTRGGEAVSLVFTDKIADCDALRKSRGGGVRVSFGKEPEGRELTLELANTFTANGKRAWKASAPRLDDKPSGGFSKKYAVEMKKATPSSEVVLRIKEDVVLGASKIFKRPKDVTVTFPTEIVATGCGAIPLNEGIPPRVQSKLSLSINGASFPVRGATLKTNPPGHETFGQYELTLSSGPHDCRRPGGSDVVVVVGIDPGEPHIKRLTLDGRLVFGGNLQTEMGADKVAMTAPVVDAGATETTIELDGGLTLFDATVKLKGSVTAKVCATP